MNELPLELYNRCRSVFLECDEFQSNESLRAVFTSGPLALYRDKISNADKLELRVDLCIEALHKRTRGGEPVLALLIEALRDRNPPGDDLRDTLNKLALDVRTTLSRSTDQPVQPITTALLAFILHFVKEVAADILSITNEQFATIFLRPDIQESLRFQVRIAFREAVAALFDRYIDSQFFERLNVNTQDLIKTRRDWLCSPDIAGKLIINASNDPDMISSDQIREHFLRSPRELNAMLLEFLVRIGALDSLPSDLERSLRENLVVGIQVEFVRRVVTDDSSAHHALFLQCMLTTVTEDGGNAPGLEEVWDELKTILMVLPEMEVWNRTLTRLEPVSQDTGQVAQSILEVDRLTAEENVAHASSTLERYLEAQVPEASSSVWSAPAIVLNRSMVREFFGPAVRLVKLTDETPASPEDVQRYYKGERLLSWNIIAA